MEGMRPALVGLAGPDGMFNRSDLADVTRSLEPDLAGRVRQEIHRRAEQKINQGRFPGLRRGFVNMHVNRNYGTYFRKGMGQARGMVGDGMEEFFTGVGVDGQAVPAQYSNRNIRLADLDGFRAGAETLREIDKARNARVRVLFPRGFGVSDLDSILADPNRRPPNGVVRMK